MLCIRELSAATGIGAAQSQVDENSHYLELYESKGKHCKNWGRLIYYKYEKGCKTIKF